VELIEQIGGWVRFFIADLFFRHAIHLNDWPEIPRPPLQSSQPELLGI
jgi:hypothetical protein